MREPVPLFAVRLFYYILRERDGSHLSPFFKCARQGCRAHTLGCVSPLLTLTTGTVNRTARAAAVRRGLKEA